MLLTGVIRDLFPEETYGTFRKRVVWLQEIIKQNPNVWQVEFWNDEGAWLDKFKTGDVVNINIAIIGRMFTKNGRSNVSNTLRGIKIQKLER